MNQSECHRPGRRRGPLFVLLASLLLAAPLAACSDPEKAKAEHIARGEAFLRERKFQEAALEFRNAVQIDEGAAQAHWGLARAYEGTAQFTEAMGELQRTVALDPNNLDARARLGNYYLIAFQQTKNSQFKEETRRLAEDILQKDPNHIEGHILRGTLLFTDGDRPGALAALQRALELNPQRVETMMSLALYHRQVGDNAKAEEIYRRALQINEGAAIAHLEYARFNVQQNRLDVAERHFRRAVEVDPQSREAHRTLASFYIFNTRQLDRAEEAVRALAALDGDKPEGRAVLADFYAQVGRHADAERAFREIAEQSPDYTAARYRLAELLMMRGDVAGANAQVKEVLDKNANDQQARLLRARLHLNSGDAKAAIEDLREVLKQDARHRAGLYYMAEAHLRSGQIEQARVFAGDLERAYPGDLPTKLMQVQIDLAAAEWQTALRQAGDLLDRLAKTAPDGASVTQQLINELRAKAHTARAAANLQLRNYSAARADFTAARDAEPSSPASYNNLASVALAEGKRDEARGHYERALSIDGANFDALNGIISLYASQRQQTVRSSPVVRTRGGDKGGEGRPGESADPNQNSAPGGGPQADMAPAHARLDQALTVRPDSAPLHYLKAQIYGIERNAQGAERSLRRALELDANFAPAFNALAALYINTNQPDQAVAELRRWAEARREDPNPHVLIGMVEDSRRNYDAACEAYRRALALRPDDVFASNNLAWNYAEHGKGNLDEAMRLAQGVVQRFPDEPGFADTLGWVYFKKGLHGAAVEQLQKAVAKTSARGADAPLYRLHLAQALAAAGRKAEARQQLQQALNAKSNALRPDQAEEARRTLATL
jgi:tetratricopeptide (TPR) repeat protein